MADRMPHPALRQPKTGHRIILGFTGSVTAGNASGINDGAAAHVIMSYQQARDRGMQPLARIVSTATAGVDPHTWVSDQFPPASKRLHELAWS